MRAVLAVGIVSLMGCGGGIAPPEFCTRTVDTFCKVLVCNGATQDDCTQAFADSRAACKDWTERDICDPGTKYDAAKAGECMDALNAMSCDQVSDTSAPPPASCDKVCI